MAEAYGGISQSGLYMSRAWVKAWVDNTTASEYSILHVQGCVNSGNEAGTAYRMSGYGVCVQVGYMIGSTWDSRNTYDLFNYAAWVGWVDATFSIPKTHNDQSIKCWCKYWGTEVKEHSAAPTSGEVNVWVTVPMKWWHWWYFDSNGQGTATQQVCKWYGESVTFPSALTRENYTFLGWNSRSDGSGIDYPPNSSQWGSDDTLTYFAHWKLNFIPPEVSIINIFRANQDGAPALNGTAIALTYTWKIDTSVDTTNSIQTAKIGVSSSSSSEYIYTDLTLTQATGTANAIIKDLLIDKAYTVIFTISDKHQTKSVSANVEVSYPTIEIGNSGKSMGIFCHAPSKEGILAVGNKSLVPEHIVKLSWNETHANPITIDESFMNFWRLDVIVESRIGLWATVTVYPQNNVRFCVSLFETSNSAQYQKVHTKNFKIDGPTINCDLMDLGDGNGAKWLQQSMVIGKAGNYWDNNWDNELGIVDIYGYRLYKE